MKNKKLVYLISSIDKGGAESHLANLALEVNKKSYKVLIVYFKGNGYWKKFLEKKGILVKKIEVNNIFSFFFNFFKLRKIVNIFQPNIIHCHLSLAEIYGYLLSKFCNLKFKFIITKHLDSFFFEASGGQKKIVRGIFLEKIIFMKADKIVFISNAVKNYFLNKIFINKKKYNVIYYGLPAVSKSLNLKSKKILKKNFKLKKKDLILGCVARHVKQKSLEFLLQAFQLSLEANYNLKLIIVGTGPLTKKLKHLANKLQIDNRVIWIPHFENIYSIINIFDISCLTSKYEGLGLFLLESMAMKKPIVATNAGAIPEIVKNNYNGFLIKSNDTKMFKNSIDKLQNKKLRSQFGKESFIILSKKFTVKEMITKFIDIYET